MKKYIVYIMALIVSTTLVQCTDLEEIPIDGVAANGGGGDNTPDFRAVFNEMNAIYAEWARQGGLKEMSGDTWAGPTRGGDWDDNAALRQIHTHTWTPDHVWLQATYKIFKILVLLRNDFFFWESSV